MNRKLKLHLMTIGAFLSFIFVISVVIYVSIHYKDSFELIMGFITLGSIAILVYWLIYILFNTFVKDEKQDQGTNSRE